MAYLIYFLINFLSGVFIFDYGVGTSFVGSALGVGVFIFCEQRFKQE